MAVVTQTSTEQTGLSSEPTTRFDEKRVTLDIYSESSSDAQLLPDASIDAILSPRYVDGIWKIAGKVLNRKDAPDLFPHYTLPGLPYYVYHDSTFWTSGFFPGSVWLLYERSLKTPLSIPIDRLLEAARKWQTEMAKEQFCKTNHDLGFMIMPSFYRDYVLTGEPSSLEVVVNSAYSLATRFDKITGVIRSWAGARTKVYDLNNPEVDYVVVIDGMMNLDLLYVAAQHTGDQRLADIATTHAKTTLQNHVRENYSTYHLVNYDARDGSVRNQLTCQGYANESTWARGQAWALYGFASVYSFTKDAVFLEAACRLADYFLSRVDEQGLDAGVVYWDFDAPRPGVWDASAACCASSGLIFLYQILSSSPTKGIDDETRHISETLRDRKHVYLNRARQILHTLVSRASSTGDALFERSTCNDNVHALHRLAEHGCVYADYYFLEAGNRLLDISKESKDITTSTS